MTETYRVEMKNISKSFGGVKALQNVDLQVKPGEIHALIGENGAGKSTLMKILSGAYQKDSGELLIDGQPTVIANPLEGRKKGVGIIYQEFALAPELTVAENIYMSHLAGNKGIINWKELYSKSRELIDRLGFDINERTLVGELSVAYQQIVEITKALSEEAKILILDEPTAVLSPREADNLFEILYSLKERGVSIIYISHRLDEIFKISDQITTMRDGKVTGRVKPSDVSLDDVIKLMIGRQITDLFPKRDVIIGEKIFEVKGLSTSVVKDIEFDVKAGEVVGFAGLVGSGRSEVARAVFGADPKREGQVMLKGKVLNIKTPRQAVQLGVGLVPESRKEQGIILSMPIKKNMTMSSLRKVTNRLGKFNSRREDEIVEDLVKKLAVKTDSIHTPVGNLSGGNQQKVVLGKWFNADCEVVFLDEPTRGVDVGAKVEIYNLINELAANGLAIVVISSELTEVIGVSDRILVMHQGEIKGELQKEEFSEENIMRVAIGGMKHGR